MQVEKAAYPENSPYHPSEKFPEYPFGENLSSERNYVYAGVRNLFYELGYDRENFGKDTWNPLGFLIEPGMTVVLKPNFVRSWHSEKQDPYSMITHPSVLRAISDYCLIALKNKGKIIIADAPQYDGNWDELLSLTKLDLVKDFFNSESEIDFDIFDLRNYWSKKRHFPSMLIPLKGDPKRNLRVNLGAESVVKDVNDPNGFTERLSQTGNGENPRALIGL